MCVWEVAHEPPRSTYWLHMNLPLYSPNAPGATRKPGYGEYELCVHSHTSPYSCCSCPLPPAATGWKQPSSTKLPSIGTVTAATSHSASVGNRAPAQRA